jgi:hypothetical protein
MAKPTKRKSRAPATPNAREAERRAARLALQRDVRQEKQIQALARQLRRELVKSDDALVELTRFVMERLTEPDDPPAAAELEQDEAAVTS